MSKRTQKFTKEELALVKHEAEKIARVYVLNPDKVFKAMLPSIESIEMIGKEVGLKCYSDKADIREVLECLPPEQTMELFENQDMEYFGKLLLFAKWLADDYNNFYSLSDWQSGLTQFCDYLSQNEESLVETGYPKDDFNASPWIGWIIGLLYPVKLRFSEENGHRWRRQTGYGIGILGDPCEYTDADWFLLSKEVNWQRLDSKELRKKVFDLKKSVFANLASEIRKCGPEPIGEEAATGVVKYCLQTGAGKLSPKEFDFLCSVDQPNNYVGFPVDPLVATKGPLRSGGLADLIEVIGHVSQELAIRPFSDGRVRLHKYEEGKSRIGIKFDLNDFIIDYSAGQAQWFEDIYRDYVNNHNEADKYLSDFNSRRTYWLEDLRIFSNAILQDGDNVLKFSQDFRSFNLDGQKFETTPMQASVCELLYIQWEAGTPTVAQGTVLQLIYYDSSHKSLKKAFGDDAIYDLLMESGERKGTVRFKEFSKIEVVNQKKSLE